MEDFSQKTEFFSEITNNFIKTKECKIHERHRRVLHEYKKKKQNFLEEYDCYPDEYDVCYDIYGNLTNEEYLSRIKNRKNSNNQYKYKEKIVYRDCNYSKREKTFLRKFYKVLAMKYHPDSNDGSLEIMTFINKLKEQWGV